MAYTALKPCTFAGQRFRVGEEIPAELVHNPAYQEKMGVLASTRDAEPVEPPQEAAAPVELLVPIEAGELAVEASYSGLQTFFSVITAKPADAERLIQATNDRAALLLVTACDSRKAVRAAADERAAAITRAEAGGVE